MTHRENSYEKMFLDWDGTVVLNKTVKLQSKSNKTPTTKIKQPPKN